MPIDANSIDWELRLGYLMHDVSRLRRSAFDRSLKPMNVTRSQWWVLAYLSRQDGMTQSKLAEELDLGKVAIGGLIDRLEKSDLVRREADSEDRRVNRVFLQPQSKSLINKMRKMNHRLNEIILKDIAGPELEATAKTLVCIKKNLLNYLNATDD
jgi:DNA-binding MarR family transcriptional regulator